MSKAVRRTAALQVTALFCRKFLVWPGSAEPEGTGSRPFLLHTPPRCQGKSRHSRTVPWGWISSTQPHATRTSSLQNICFQLH